VKQLEAAEFRRQSGVENVCLASACICLCFDMVQHDPIRINFFYCGNTALDPWPYVTPEGLEQKKLFYINPQGL